MPTIEWLSEIELGLEAGRDYFACPMGIGGDWLVRTSLDAIKLAAEDISQRMEQPVPFYKVMHNAQAAPGDSFLVPTRLEAGESDKARHIRWSVIDTRQAAELLRDVRFGPAPFFVITQLGEVTCASPKAPQPNRCG